MHLALILLGLLPSWGRAEGTIEASGVTGGVLVHLGCADGRRTVQLCRNKGFFVHGLDVDAANIKQARELIRKERLFGRVSVDTFDGTRLPYVDNMVNLIIAERLGNVSQAELMRVLAPRGVAMIKTDGNWSRVVKPVPSDIDEWTHYLHDADNNAVANDTVVGPPRRLQWQGGPKWTRHHDCMSSLSGLVSSGGRIIFIIDEGSTASIFMPSYWSLVARDAFNGKILWKRKISDWYTRFMGLKSGPADAPRRLVAVGNRVYATLSLKGPVTSLDAVTGKTIHVYAGTEGAEEILLADDLLLVLVGPGSLEDGRRRERPKETRSIRALRAESGEVLWRTDDVVAAGTLATDGRQVYYFNFDQKKAVCLDWKTGKTVWRSEALPAPARQTSFFTPRLVVRNGVVLFASGEFSGMTKSGGGETRSDTLTAISAETGKTLWKAKHPPSGYSSPENLFVIDGVVWCDASSNGRLNGMVTGIDLKTGQKKFQFPADKQSYWFHHRCYPGRASSNYIMTSRTGIEFIDFRKQHWDLNHWVRGACLYGIMPCNGLIYTPPSPCICYAEAYIHGFNAFAPGNAIGAVTAKTDRPKLEKGVAYGEPVNGRVEDGDWPTYRGTNARSGFNRVPTPSLLNDIWETPVGGKLSSVIVADGKLFVAAVDRHAVHALDAVLGTKLWRFTTGGRVDSPPTYYQGRLLFGSADGCVYCLRAEDGQLLWRFRASSIDRRILAEEQIESLWPVHGNVLVRDGVAYFAAGRSAFVDGGMHLYGLDVKTGKVVLKCSLDNRNPNTGNDLQELVKWLNMPVARPDILSCDDQHIFMRSQAFDFNLRRQRIGPTRIGNREGSLQTAESAHLFCPTGFLDGTSFHRTYWLYGSTWGSGWNGYFVNGKYAPAGKIMVVNDDTVFGFGRQPQYYKWTLPMEYRLFAAKKQWQASKTQRDETIRRRTGKKKRKKSPGPVINQENYRWIKTVPILVRAMTLTGDTLFVAGPRDVLDEKTLGGRKAATTSAVLKQEAALEGKDGSVLWAVSAKDGSRLADYEIDALPVFDGMAAANGRLYLSTTDGNVRCFEAIGPQDTP